LINQNKKIFQKKEKKKKMSQLKKIKTNHQKKKKKSLKIRKRMNHSKKIPNQFFQAMLLIIRKHGKPNLRRLKINSKLKL
jgi:hypothetical protein